MKTIAYQGMEGSFSHLTAMQEFGSHHKFLGQETFRDVFLSLEKGHAEYAVLPIENSLVGSIYENYDFLNQYDTCMISEHFTRIEHCLLALPDGNIKQIKKVLSHPKALEQCLRFFQDHPWVQPIIHTDTAAAAAEIKQRKDPEYAAIASAGAGRMYDLLVLERGIEDDPQNYTRFVTLTKKSGDCLGGNKCSLIAMLSHIPGTLADFLALFAEQGINLTKIESRPLRGIPFEYIFYIDIEFTGKSKDQAEQMLFCISRRAKKLKILGFYKAGSL